MQPELAGRDIRVVALSKDTVEQAAVHKARDGLTLTLLADPKLKVIRQYGLEHHKTLNLKTGSFMIGGIPLSFVPSFKTMAIPTSMLIDEDGVIQWIDQAEDYRIRSDDQRVLAGIEAAFGQTAPA